MGIGIPRAYVHVPCVSANMMLKDWQTRLGAGRSRRGRIRSKKVEGAERRKMGGEKKERRQEEEECGEE